MGGTDREEYDYEPRFHHYSLPSREVPCDDGCWVNDAEYMIGTGWDDHLDVPIVKMICSACKELLEEIPEVTQIVFYKSLARKAL